MNPDDLVANGFFLALTLCDSFGRVYDRDGQVVDANPLMTRLAEVARGDTSLYNNIDEEFAEAERNRGGQPATPQERAYFENIFANRGAMDRANREAASAVMRIVAGDAPPPRPQGR